ncbi:MAG: pilus assembly protein PilM [Candidatus Magasanikbacteria bacterium]|nr:pilus assembly protein PilM [Candidatus Magasanikbacteria bacterium]
MGLFGTKKESFLGVDIGANGIKIVELHKSKERPQLWTYGIVEQGLDIHVLRAEKTAGDLIEERTGSRPKQNNSGALRRDTSLIEESKVQEYARLLTYLVKKSKIQARRATSSLPVSEVFHTIINFPKMDKKHRDDLVKAEIAKLLPRPVEEMQIVHQELATAPEDQKKYTRLLVTAAPKELVAFYTAIFQKAGLQLIELETEAFALARSLVGKDNSVSMLIDLGAERTNFFIVDNGIPVTHRSLQMGGHSIDEALARLLAVPVEKARHLKQDLSSCGENEISFKPFVTLLDPISKEIQYNFDLYLKQIGNQNKRPEKIILTGGSSLFPPLIDYIKKTFPLRVFVGDPWARVLYQEGIKSVLDEFGPRMSVAVGLALRNFN